MPIAPATRKTRATYASLVAASREGVRRDGALSPETVAEIAGVSPATLYTYFGSKDALLAAGFDQALGDIGDSVGPILSIERLLDDGWEVVARALVRTVVRGFSHDGRLVRLALARLQESEEVVAVYSRRRDEQLEMMTRFIRLGSAAGQLRTGDIQTMARTLMVHLQALQNPLTLSPGAGPVVEEMVGSVYRLLHPET